MWLIFLLFVGVNGVVKVEWITLTLWVGPLLSNPTRDATITCYFHNGFRNMRPKGAMFSFL